MRQLLVISSLIVFPLSFAYSILRCVNLVFFLFQFCPLEPFKRSICLSNAFLPLILKSESCTLLYISLFSGFWKIINLVGQLNDMSPLWISREVTFFSDPLLLLSPRWNIISLKYIFPIETVVGENQTKIQIGGFKPPSTLKCSRLWWLWEEPRWGGHLTSENTESNFKSWYQEVSFIERCWFKLAIPFDCALWRLAHS